MVLGVIPYYNFVNTQPNNYLDSKLRKKGCARSENVKQNKTEENLEALDNRAHLD